MEINTSVQLGLEQALKALIPFLQNDISDPLHYYDFLDVFPPPSSTTFLYLAGHEATDLPDDKIGYLAFIAGLPDYRAIGMKYPKVPVKMDLATAGIGDKNTRDEAALLHSQRTAALIRLFSPRYFEDLRWVFNFPGAPGYPPWDGLGFDAWNAEPPQDGRSANGNAFIASPTYSFVVHFKTEPAI